MKIRNFCIVAHIDHGKSTLADRMLEYTKTVSLMQMRAQMLDDMDIERERGITIKSKTVRLNYIDKNSEHYIFNLIDTPGHVDFSYEVSRALKACEGAILLIDASQGVEAQTLANNYLAKNIGLKIIPAINKIDLQSANVPGAIDQVYEILEIPEDPILISAKTGQGVPELMQAIVDRIPEPKGGSSDNLAAIVFDSFYDSFRGVIIYTRLFTGKLRAGMDIVFLSSGMAYRILEVGYLQLKMVPCEELDAGEVGYIIAGIKDIHHIKIGDIIYEKDKPLNEKYSSYEEIKPFVFAGIYNINPGEYDDLKLALEKLHLTDSSFQYKPVNSDALGPGFHCGFLGTLHLEIINERLQREYNLNLIITTPNVNYRVKKKNLDKIIEIDDPAKFPQPHDIESVEEPFVKSMIITPTEFLSNIVELCKSKRAKVVEIKQLDSKSTLATFEMPLAEIIVGFYDSLKSVSKGYASFDYEQSGYTKSDLVKMEVLVNGDVVDTFAYVVHETKISTVAHRVMGVLRSTIPRQMFNVSLQIQVKNKIILRDDIRAIKKDVIAKCYGGDISRKRKLLEKQKEGKKKMKQFGKVDIPQETFLGLLKVNSE